MARKNQLVYPLALAQSLGASFVTSPTLIKYLDNCAYQIDATTSDAVGTFDVEASLDYAVDEANGNTVTNAGRWIPLTLAGGVPTLSGVNDDIMINLNQLPFTAIRLRYTRVSGTGAADLYVASRQVGG